MCQKKAHHKHDSQDQREHLDSIPRPESGPLLVVYRAQRGAKKSATAHFGLKNCFLHDSILAFAGPFPKIGRRN